MARYAQIDNGLVIWFYETDGDITEMFPAALTFVNCDNWPAIELGWIGEKINGVWNFRPWTISSEEILRINTINKAYKRSLALEPMAMSLIGAKLCYYVETGNTVLAKQWQDWYAAWDAVDLTIENTVWPTPPNAV